MATIFHNIRSLQKLKGVQTGPTTLKYISGPNLQ